MQTEEISIFFNDEFSDVLFRKETFCLTTCRKNRIFHKFLRVNVNEFCWPFVYTKRYI